jgi:hypothetical protein
MNEAGKSSMGGGIASFNSTLTLDNCTFYGNFSEEYEPGLPGRGAALYLLGTPTILQNSIISFSSGGGAIHCAYDQVDDTVIVPDLFCCDVYGNEMGDWVDSIAGQANQAGNFSSDPQFCDTLLADFYLLEMSPCIDSNNICGVLIGAFISGCLPPVDVDDLMPMDLPELQLFQNRPNPFNLSTVIEYSIPTLSHVNIEIFNVLGHRVRQLVNETKIPGRYTTSWNGRDNSGNVVASGIYFYRVITDDSVETKRMILIK